MTPALPSPTLSTTTEALAWLAAEGLADAVSTFRNAITGVAPDEAAGPGDVAWLSPSADPARVAKFAGALLILGAHPDAMPACAVAVARDPRLAFSRLVAHLWPHASHPGWPTGPPAGVAADAQIHATAVLAPGVVIGADVVVGAGSRVGPNTCLAHCTIGAGVDVGPNATIGTAGFGYTRDPDGRLVPFPHLGRVVIEDDVAIGANTCIDRGALGETRIGAGTRIDNLVHIAHNAQIGRDVAVIAHAVVAGSVTVGDGAWIAPGAVVRNRLTVGAGATVGMGATVVRDVPPGATVAGNPARLMGGG